MLLTLPTTLLPDVLENLTSWEFVSRKEPQLIMTAIHNGRIYLSVCMHTDDPSTRPYVVINLPGMNRNTLGYDDYRMHCELQALRTLCLACFHPTDPLPPFAFLDLLIDLLPQPTNPQG